MLVSSLAPHSIKWGIIKCHWNWRPFWNRPAFLRPWRSQSIQFPASVALTDSEQRTPWPSSRLHPMHSASRVEWIGAGRRHDAMTPWRHDAMTSPNVAADVVHPWSLRWAIWCVRPTSPDIWTFRPCVNIRVTHTHTAGHGLPFIFFISPSSLVHLLHPPPSPCHSDSCRDSSYLASDTFRTPSGHLPDTS